MIPGQPGLQPGIESSPVLPCIGRRFVLELACSLFESGKVGPPGCHKRVQLWAIGRAGNSRSGRGGCSRCLLSKSGPMWHKGSAVSPNRRLEHLWVELVEESPRFRVASSRFGLSNYLRSQSSLLVCCKRRRAFQWFSNCRWPSWKAFGANDARDVDAALVERSTRLFGEKRDYETICDWNRHRGNSHKLCDL